MVIRKLVLMLSMLCTVAVCFTPEIVELQLRIAGLQSLNQQYSQARYKEQGSKDKSSSQYLPEYQLSSMQLVSLCDFKGVDLKALSFQTTGQLYFAINFKQANLVQIYNSECKLMSTLNQMQLKLILTDRGISQTGVVYFISEEHHLVQIKEDSKFQNSLRIAELTVGNNSIVGGIARYRGKERVEIYISYKDGTLEVYDESGNNKMKLFLEGSKSQIKLMADHHPYPLIATTSNWVSMLDTSKYIEIVQNCPFIPNIKYIFSENYYGQTIYIINSEKIHVLNFEISKKLCTIKREYNLPLEISEISKASFYSNTLFFDNRVFNTTERKLYQRTDCSGRSSLEFYTKRSANDKQFCIKTCCQNENCTVSVSLIYKTQEGKSIFIYLTVSFIVILLISLSLMKKTGGSNLDLDENIRETNGQKLTQQKMAQMSKKNREKGNKHKRQ